MTFGMASSDEDDSDFVAKEDNGENIEMLLYCALGRFYWDFSIIQLNQPNRERSVLDTFRDSVSP